MKIKLFAVSEIQYFELRIFSFISYVYDLTRDFNLPTRAFNLPTHCVKSVQIRSYFWSVFNPNAGKYGPEITPYLDTSRGAIITIREVKLVHAGL